MRSSSSKNNFVAKAPVLGCVCVGDLVTAFGSYSPTNFVVKWDKKWVEFQIKNKKKKPHPSSLFVIRLPEKLKINFAWPNTDFLGNLNTAEASTNAGS